MILRERIKAFSDIIPELVQVFFALLSGINFVKQTFENLRLQIVSFCRSQIDEFSDFFWFPVSEGKVTVFDDLLDDRNLEVGIFERFKNNIWIFFINTFQKFLFIFFLFRQFRFENSFSSNIKNVLNGLCIDSIIWSETPIWIKLNFHNLIAKF